MKNSRSIIKKVSLIAGICLLFICIFTVLNHSIGNAWVTTNYHPALTDNPVYVDFTRTTPLTVEITPSEDFTMNSVDVVLVNISGDSRGTLLSTLSDSEGNVISSSRDALSTITVGSWYSLQMGAYLVAGDTYTLTFSVDSENPYFMSLDSSVGDALPYTMNIPDHGDAYISLGFQRVDIVPQTFGDIFYYSIPICVILFVVAIVWAILGKKFTVFISHIPLTQIIKSYGNEIFLVLTYIAIVLSIYSHSYVGSVYITSDSTGYMREAVNLLSGNGFSYDGIAGYNTWFANWPILYPAMISIVMLITRTNAYFASKLLSMFIVLVIMLVIYAYARKDAWIYSLSLLNIGFISLTWYTWSEIPFMLFIMCFGLMLGKILKEEFPAKKYYVLTGVFAILSFMTRYYGMFVFFVIGIYVLYYFYQWIKCRKENNAASLLSKWLFLAITACVSGLLSLSYLMLNKIQNGMASGVARTMWWDDYGILTDDLITSLETEFFHIFHLETPDFISSMSVSMQVFVLFIILIGIAFLIVKPIKKMNEHSAWIVMAVVYYILFIAIRYVSSMDTFYFRFWEPATFLLTLGIIGYILPYLRAKNDSSNMSPLNWTGVVISALIIISSINLCLDDGITATPYYEELTSIWDDAYSEIPTKSVVIFSDLDFRSSYYRPDVIEGSIDPSMSMADIKAAYYGSDYMCLKVTDAKAMVAEPVYQPDIETAIRTALEKTSEDSRYICISLK